MSEFRDRNPGLALGRLVVLAVLALAALVAIPVILDLRLSRGLAIALGLVPVLVLVFGVLGPALHWWGVDLTVGASGIRFGARSAPTPARYRGPGVATRYPLTLPWKGIRAAALAGPGETSRLVAAGRAGLGPWGQVSRLWGWFPSKGASHHLLLTVDPAAVSYPPDSRRLGFGAVNLVPSSAWALPVRDVDGLRRAFAAAGVPLRDTADGVSMPAPG